MSSNTVRAIVISANLWLIHSYFVSVCRFFIRSLLWYRRPKLWTRTTPNSPHPDIFHTRPCDAHAPWEEISLWHVSCAAIAPRPPNDISLHTGFSCHWTWPTDSMVGIFIATFIVIQLVSESVAFVWTESWTPCSQKPATGPSILSPSNLVPTTNPSFHGIHSDTITTSMSTCPKWSHFTNFPTEYFLFPTTSRHMPPNIWTCFIYPAHSIYLWKLVTFPAIEWCR
jgi:hypothetical protein